MGPLAGPTERPFESRRAFFVGSVKGSPMLSADIVRPESARYTTSLLCIPGLWAGPDVWRAFAAYLAHRGWESNLLDVRALDAGVAERAAAVAAHAAALPTPPVLLGHDLGSLVALAAAARTRTAAVVLLAPLVPGSAPARALALRPGTFLQLLLARPVPPPGVRAAAPLCGELAAPLGRAVVASLAPESPRVLREVVRPRTPPAAVAGVPALAGARGGKPLADLGCLGLEERVQAALRLGLPGPAAAPLVAAGERRPRARRAADARVPLLEERMGGDTVTLEVVERVLRRPRRQRVHLVEGALLELLDDRDRCPRRRLIPPPTVDPGTHAREIALERLDLVDVAAEVRVARVEVEAVARGELGARHDRLELDEPESQAAHDLVTVGEGLGEVEPRVDEHDRRLGGDRMQHVGEDDAVVLEGAGEHHVGPKALPRPRENPFRSRMLELAVPLGDRHVATVTQGYGTGNAARRLSHQRAPL